MSNPTHSYHKFPQIRPEFEQTPVKYTIAEDEAENWVLELSEVLENRFPNLDPKFVSEIVTSCIQDHVKITDTLADRKLEMTPNELALNSNKRGPPALTTSDSNGNDSSIPPQKRRHVGRGRLMCERCRTAKGGRSLCIPSGRYSNGPCIPCVKAGRAAECGARTWTPTKSRFSPSLVSKRDSKVNMTLDSKVQMFDLDRPSLITSAEMAAHRHALLETVQFEGSQVPNSLIMERHRAHKVNAKGRAREWGTHEIPDTLAAIMGTVPNPQGEFQKRGLSATVFGGHGQTASLWPQSKATEGTKSGRFCDEIEIRSLTDIQDGVSSVEAMRDANAQSAPFGDAIQLDDPQEILLLMLWMVANVNAQDRLISNTPAHKNEGEVGAFLLEDGPEIRVQAKSFGEAQDSCAYSKRVTLVLKSSSGVKEQGGMSCDGISTTLSNENTGAPLRDATLADMVDLRILGRSAFDAAGKKDLCESLHFNAGGDCTSRVNQPVRPNSGASTTAGPGFHWHQASQAYNEDEVDQDLRTRVNSHVNDRAWQARRRFPATAAEPPVVESLLRKTTPSTASKYRQQELLLASKRVHKNMEIAFSMVANDAAIDKEGQMKMHLFQGRCYRAAVQPLLCIIDPLAVNTYGQTVLHLAAQGGYEEVVELLLGMGANVGATDKDQRTVLHLASQGGQRDVVELLLGSGSDPSGADERGQTALHLASQGGHRDVVELLIRRGSDPSATNICGQTALHLAAQGGHEGVVELLLSVGANIHAVDQDQHTVLHLAIQGRHRNLVKVLFRRDNDPSTADGYVLLINKGVKAGALECNRSPSLGHAASAVRKDVVELVVGESVDMSAVDEKSWTILCRPVLGTTSTKDMVEPSGSRDEEVYPVDQVGVKSWDSVAPTSHRGVVEPLLSDGANYARSEDRWITLRWTTWGDDKDVIELLLGNGADVGVELKDGWTPPHSAASRGHTDVLVGKREDINAKIKEGMTSLHWAAENGCNGVRKLLLSNAVAVSSVDKEGSTPLSFATEGANMEVELLVSHGVVGYMDDDANPVHCVGWKGHSRVVQLLVSNGAEVGAVDQDGRTLLLEPFGIPLKSAVMIEAADKDRQLPLSWEVQRGSTEFLKLNHTNIEEADKNGRSPLRWAAMIGSCEAVNWPLSASANINVLGRKYNEQSPLSWAAETRRAESAKLPLKGGANIMAPDKIGLSPLSIAAHTGHVEVVKLLLNAGANVEAADKNGRSPLSWAAEIGNCGAVKLLLNAGANSKAADKNGKSPWNWAAKWGNTGVLELLSNADADVEVDNDGHFPVIKAPEIGNGAIRVDDGANIGVAERNGLRTAEPSIGDIVSLSANGVNANPITVDGVGENASFSWAAENVFPQVLKAKANIQGWKKDAEIQI